MNIGLLRNQRGVALPMALMALVITATLVVAFSVLSATEPPIASNQLLVAQARAVAESGVERALWALTEGKVNPGAASSIPYPMASTPAPYDGSASVSVAGATGTVGSFLVTVTAGAVQNERNVVAVGWAPTDASSDKRTKAHQRITATLMDLAFNPLNMMCALCVRGDIQVSGTSNISAKEDTSCGNRFGTWSTLVVDPATGTVITAGTTTIGSGAATVFGADGNTTANQASDMAIAQSQTSFDANRLTSADYNALKAIAKARGTYYQGAVTFEAANKMPDGIIFVDTVSGNNITSSTPASDYADVTIHGNAAMGAGNIFRGWIVVNGTLSISGNIEIRGLVYAENDISYTGTGTGQIVGQVISANVKDTVATVVDTSTSGNSSIIYNCNYARGGDGFVPPNFMVKAGTYREVSDP
jgi:hypothetical protein